MSRLQRNDTRDTITIRINTETKSEYQDIIDESMSDDLRQYINTVVETQSTSSAIPTKDTRLRQGHNIILDIKQEYQSNTLETDIVKTKLSDKLNISKEAVKPAILEPLQERNLIQPLWGKIKVIEQ